MVPPKKKPVAAKKGKSKEADSKAAKKGPKKPGDKPKGKKGGPKEKKGGKKGGPKEKKGGKPVAAPLDLGESGPQNLPAAVDDAKEKIDFTKTGVIFLLWSFEILHHLTHSITTSFLHNGITDGKLTQDIHAHRTSSVAMMVFVTCTTMTVANFVADKPKFSALMIGLTVYSLVTTVLGIKMLEPRPIGYAVVLILAQIGWYAATPLRYWFIFHQSFPLSVTTSLIIVTFNRFLVAIAEYPGAVWIENKLFGVRTYLFCWIASSLAFTIWLGTLLHAKASNSMNNTSDDKEAVENKYKSTEVASSFEARQTPKHKLFFVLLIIPSIMFPVVKETIGIVVEKHRNPYPITYYRLDIIIAAVMMPVASAFLLCLTCLRHEIRNMVLAGIAQYLNISVLVLCFLLVKKYPEQFRGDKVQEPIVPRTMNMSLGAVFILTDDRIMYYKEGEDNSNSPYKNLPKSRTYISIEKKIKEQVLLPIHLYDSRKKLIASKEISLAPKEISVYILFGNVIIPLQGSSKWFEKYPERPLYFFFNACEPCPDEPPNVRPNIGKVWWDESCKSLTIETTQLRDDTLGNPTVLSTFLEKIPLSGQIIGPLSVMDRVLQLQETVFLNEMPHFAHLFDIRPDNIWTIFTIRCFAEPKLVVPAPSQLPLVVWQKVHLISDEEPTTCPVPTTTKAPVPDKGSLFALLAMCESGVPIGISSVSYIHFVWMQCPYDDRMLILASFFTINYVGGWIARHFLVEINTVALVVLLAMQGLFLIWHIVALIFFRRTLPPRTEEEKIKGNNRRF
ncbi:Hypothetical protein NTJ_06634 [Nesidiocoris tenuis]|uniref:Uncharacterized protein n=1 Tax=Nesidiocoris tenuis TaxID=355587 RepID=A0ABN7ASB5_9HEMI|nr:Hypothetical protein NTJ_06634 [Nesidiocoris tenuis]